MEESGQNLVHLSGWSNVCVSMSVCVCVERFIHLKDRVIGRRESFKGIYIDGEGEIFYRLACSPNDCISWG